MAWKSGQLSIQKIYLPDIIHGSLIPACKTMNKKIMNIINSVTTDILHQATQTFKWTFFFVIPVAYNLFKIFCYAFPSFSAVLKKESMKNN
jgi:hypothetical protein